MLTTSNYGLKKPESTDPVSINDFNDNADTIDTALAKKLESTSKAGDMTTEFSQASNRTNLISGEAIKTSLGKIMKYFTDLKGAAFAAIANNLTTTTTGSVLDATQGKALDGKITDLSSEIGDVNTNLQTKVNDALSSIASLNTDLAIASSNIDYLYGAVVNLDSSLSLRSIEISYNTALLTSYSVTAYQIGRLCIVSGIVKPNKSGGSLQLLKASVKPNTSTIFPAGSSSDIAADGWIDTSGNIYFSVLAPEITTTPGMCFNFCYISA